MPATSRTTLTASAATATDWRHQMADRLPLSLRTRMVALAAHGLDERGGEGLVDLAAQVADVDLDDVGIPVEVRGPDVAQQGVLGDSLAGVARQVLQEGELARGQLDEGLATADDA